MKGDHILISLLVGFMWGVSPIAQKHFLKKFDKTSLIVFFSSIYFLLILCFSIFNQKTILKDLQFLNGRDIILIIGYVFFTIFLTNLLILEVLKTHDSYIVSALESTAPFFTLILVYLFFDEKITLIGVLGVLLIVLGIFCIALNDSTFKIEEFIGIR